MKKLLRVLLCAALAAGALTASALAAEGEPPPLQGDFYVLVNGEYVTFPDAVPQLKDGRSFLPFVAVFGQLGFAEEDMTWDGATSTVTAEKEGVFISLTQGSKSITVEREGETTVYEVDVAPYIDAATSRTYIPFGLAAEVLGYNVGWDAVTGTVIIDDIDAILAANDETYELMDKYLDYVRPYTTQNQRVTGRYTMDVDVSEQIENQGELVELMGFTMRADMDYDMVMDSTAVEYDALIDMDMSMSLAGEDVTELMVGLGAWPDLPEKLETKLRGDLAEGILYEKSPISNMNAGLDPEADVWFRLDDTDNPVLGGVTMGELFQLSAGTPDMTFAEQLEATLRALEPVSVGYTASDALAEFNLMYADSAFTRSGSSYVNTLEWGEGSSGEWIQGTELTLTLYTSGSRVNGYAIQMSGQQTADGEVMDMDVLCSVRGSRLEMSVTAVTSSHDPETGDESAGTISVTMDGTYQSTSRQPQTEPPAGAVILDMMEGEESVPTPL